MLEEIIISGSSVLLRNVEEVKRINVDDFYASLTKTLLTETPILPDRVVYYAALDEKKLFVTHKQPCMEKLNVLKIINDEDSVEAYEVSHPHIYMFHLFVNLAFEQLYVYGANEKIRATDEFLLKLPLKNLHPDCKVCLGDDLRFKLEGSFQAKMLRVERHFWDSAFNSDLDNNYLSVAPVEWKGNGDPIEHWAKQSADASFDPCKVNWIKHLSWQATVKAILRG